MTNAFWNWFSAAQETRGLFKEHRGTGSAGPLVLPP
jgi:hypothetical protein